MKEFRQTIQLMKEVLKINPEDPVAKMYINRCEKNLQEGIDENWTGIIQLDIK